MTAKIRTQLSVMMFLEYYIWGTWFVAMGPYLSETLHATNEQVGTIYGLAWVGAMISPFFVGAIADKYFSAQKVNGVLHLIGAGLLYFLAQVQEIGLFYWGMLVYSMMYMPTIALTNSVAMNQSSNNAQDFPLLRVLGTLAWIVANVVIGLFDLGSSNYIFLIPTIASFVFGLYSFSLPDTPPKPHSGANIFDALAMFKDRSYFLFFLGSVLLCIPLSFYYSFANIFLSNGAKLDNVESIMAILGQGSEVGFMIALPFFLKRWGVRTILLVGMGAWVLRYLLFKFGMGETTWLVYIGVALHGICYDFFFATGQIYTDQKAPENMKSAAQGLITFATYGVGLTVGSVLSGQVAQRYTDTTGNIDWADMWLVPAAIAGIIFGMFLLGFREKQTN